MGDAVNLRGHDWNTAVDSYVVYIYRRPRKRGDELVGLVELVGNGERKSFRSAAQLLEYLLTERSGRKEEPARRRASKKS